MVLFWTTIWNKGRHPQKQEHQVSFAAPSVGNENLEKFANENELSCNIFTLQQSLMSLDRLFSVQFRFPGCEWGCRGKTVICNWRSLRGFKQQILRVVDTMKTTVSVDWGILWSNKLRISSNKSGLPDIRRKQRKIQNYKNDWHWSADQRGGLLYRWISRGILLHCQGHELINVRSCCLDLVSKQDKISKGGNITDQ